MTSSDREQLLAYLVEAELYEGRLSDMWAGAKSRAGSAYGRAQGAAREADAFVRGELRRPAVVIPGQKLAKTDRHAAVAIPAQRLPAERGIPGYRGTQAYGMGVTAARRAGEAISAGRARGSALVGAVPGAARSVGGFISAGARGQGIAPAISDFRKVRKLGDAGKTARSIAMGQLAGAGGRTAAVYGGGALLAAGGALGARSAYRRYKRRKAEREE